MEPLRITQVTDAARPAEGLIGEWALHGTSYPAQAALYEVPGGFDYWTSDAGRFGVRPAAGLIEVPGGEDELLREQRLMGLPMLLSFAHRGDFSLHAAAVEVNGRAVVLAGPSHAGKTTLAAAFHAAGHRLLSEDLVCCRLGPSGVSVLPGPALVRLRPDVFEPIDWPGFDVVAVRPDRVFLSPSRERAGDSAPVPLAGVFFLRESSEVAVSRSPAAESVRDYWHLGYRMPTVEGRSASFQQLGALAAAVPGWNLSRPLRLDCLAEAIASAEGCVG